MKETEDSDISISLSEAVKSVRIKAGLSQEKLAKMAGISKVTLIKAEKGGNTGSNVLMKIAKATGKTLQIRFK
ncbi:helix-turn-helix transcriptional regulator [Secundilactobacillus kimchicus]|uniref:helix-turn-helix transcriptional regulator n=1 Tax=Secundilactobacillus kimchicus TaxID=528209 RepID=UPI0024A86EB5|nr:helix-turn-helix transcriptional regulator [Secundilactobacillus kimchicus]